MSALNEICQFCGGEIVFRVIKGVTTPVHLGDSQCDGRKLYRRDRDGIPHETTCPRCYSKVIFLRHNGGSVWLDQLGWPWPKHPCFEDDTSRAWSLVFPSQIGDIHGALYMFAICLGICNKGRPVIFLGLEKRDLNRNPKYHQFWQYEVANRDGEETGVTANYFSKKTPVIVGLKQNRLLTLHGEEFTISKHEPNYYG